MNLKELSESLGLSQTTVSRGLNNYSDVSEATRKRIKDAAKRLNYRPNARAKGLATGKSRTIGHVIPSNTQHEMVNPIFGDFIAGASSVYARHGYNMLVSRVAQGSETEIYNDLISSGAVDGIVIQGPTEKDQRIEQLSSMGTPFAVHGRSSAITKPYPWVDVNNQRAFERATQLLISLGHRKIALLNGLEHLDFAVRRRNGFLKALGAQGIEADPDMLFSEEMTESYGYLRTKELLDRKDLPTAIVTSSLITALGVRRAIEDSGRRMGKDISVVTHDDMLSYLPNGGAEPVFTATRSAVSEAGERLAEMLIAEINGDEDQPSEVLLEAELVIGRSTGASET
ncbi:MAG: substrate-binding domain-containing protein [Rhodobacteraceae bacterium]|nr:substrate-binding domain-containing protein [Paracoccaceae bacterium]